MQSILSGLVAAPFTPFNSDGSLALATVRHQAALLAANGVTGAFVCGTTGEGSSLTSEERLRLVEAWRAAAPPTLKLVVHVGHLSLAESRAFARHAEAAGADAIATLAPSFFRPARVADLTAWCREVAAAAPSLPFYYYHMPAMTGVAIPVADFLAEAGASIPTLVGVKFTHEDLYDYGRSGQVEGGRYSLLFGRDEILLAGLALGAAGAVGSTYNYAAPLFHRLIAAFDAGDLAGARREQARARDFIAVMNRHGGLAAGKAIMALIGLDCGPVRPPLRSPQGADLQSLENELRRIGFFDYACRLP